MSSSNGVIRIGRKGLTKFAFGDGNPFEVDVVVAFQQWITIDNDFRSEEDPEGNRSIPTAQMLAYHEAAVSFVEQLSSNGHQSNRGTITTAEALDFLARLREQYDELATFFRPRLRGEPALPDTSEPALRFSEEPENSQTSTS